MAAVDEVDELIKQFRLAQGEFLKGNPEPVKKLFFQREDATLANPCARNVGRPRQNDDDDRCYHRHEHEVRMPAKCLL